MNSDSADLFGEMGISSNNEGSINASRARELRYLILAVQREGNRWLAEMLRSKELTPAQAEVLTVLADNGPLTLSELGRLLICENGSPSRLVSTVVKRGLVLQSNHETDRRAKLFTLSDAGWAALKDFSEIEASIDTFLDALLSPTEQRFIIDSFYKILKGTSLEGAMLQRFSLDKNHQ